MDAERTDESVLVERLRRGDEEAFLHLVRQLHGSLQRFVRRFVASEATAEEIAQETWLAMLQALPRFAQKASLKSWIFSIAANLARSRAAREARTVLFDDLAAATDEEEPAVDPSRFDAAGYWHLPPRPWDDLSPERLLQAGTRPLALYG